MKLEILSKETINVGKFEVMVDNKNYLIYLSQNKEMKFSEFYITEQDCAIISFCAGVQWEDITPSVEEFINNNILEWIKNFNAEDKVINEYYNTEIDMMS